MTAFLLFISNGLAVYPHVEEWNSGSLAGWTANTVDSTVVHVATGGNPDGHIQTRGPSPGSFDIAVHFIHKDAKLFLLKKRINIK